MKRLLIVIVVLVSVGSMATASHIIDDFSDSGNGAGIDIQLTQPSVGTSGPVLKTGLSGVTGGRRQITLTVTTHPGGFVDATTGVIVSAPPDRFVLAQDPGVDGLAILEYGSYAGAAFTGLDRDLSLDLALTFDLISADLTGGTAKAEIDTSTGTLTRTEAINVASGPVQFLFSNFTGTGDLSQVNGLRYTFDGPADWDIQISKLSSDDVIPEPATMSLLGLGLLALVRRRKRK